MTEKPGVLADLPPDLHYLISPALRYGRYQFESAILDFIVRANKQEREELIALAAEVLRNNDYPRVKKFLDEHPLRQSQEAACLYFLFGVLDHADLQFDRAMET